VPDQPGRYVERAPEAALTDLVASVWIHQVAANGPPYRQRNLPHGGAELVCTVGAAPRAFGPLTRAQVELLGPGSTLVGLRLRPGAVRTLFGLPPGELVDLAVPGELLWGGAAAEIGDRVAAAASPPQALAELQRSILARRRDAQAPDPLVAAAVRRLMPGRASGVGALPGQLAVSERQLRRRFLAAVGLGPKTLHRTLRFQGFLARAQQAFAAGRAPADDGLAALAVTSGYTDQAHLTRECLRLTGATPRAFLGEAAEQCACGHDHAASFLPLLGS
jgi:AraC-like DNA-binding protein